MSDHFQIKCLDCGTQSKYSPLDFYCPHCGGEWHEAIYDYGKYAKILPAILRDRPFNLLRYKELLPIHSPNRDLSLGEGGTPVIRATNLGMMLGNTNIYIKDERQGPTASFKDRQAAVTITALKEAGITDAVIASTGNVAISYSAYASRAGIKLWAFLTSLVPAEKMREVAIYGTQVVKVTSSYDQAKKVAAQFARQRGFYLDRGTRSIPSVEGMKTIAYEIAEQYTEITRDVDTSSNGDREHPAWRTPDWYIQAVSGGLGPVGVHKGFRELRNMGLIDRIPKLGIIQTEGCNPMVRAWKQGLSSAEPIVSPRTHIATLSTGNPGRSYTLLQGAMRTEGGGVFESVTDQEAFRAMHVVAKMEGLSMEPASAVAFAGVIKLIRNGVIKPHESVVINCTGHTMPIEKLILGKGWARNVVLPSDTAFETPEEGLLSALNRVTADRYPKVLVVDDHPDARRLIMRILQSQGTYTLLQAENGLEAVKIAQDEVPDLIVLDLMMPGLDGFAVLDELKKEDKTSNIPVVVVTAKELTPQEKKRLEGQILMQKGSFMDNDLLDKIQNSFP